jgi:hypothetical protein
LNCFFKYIKDSNENIEEDMIDQNLFVELITLCALEVNFPDPQPTLIDKVN